MGAKVQVLPVTVALSTPFTMLSIVMVKFEYGSVQVCPAARAGSLKSLPDVGVKSSRWVCVPVVGSW